MTQDRSRAEQRLMNKAVHYLGRYIASQQRLREVLRRFAMRKLESHDAAELARAIEAVVADCIRLGYVDDAAFAMARARSKRRGGGSALAIRRGLAQHAIDKTLVDEALAAADETTRDGELAAALRLGFSFATARAVIDLEGPEAADRLAESLQEGAPG